MRLELRKSYALIEVCKVIDLAWTTWYPAHPGTVDHNNASRADPECYIIFVTFPNSIHFVQSLSLSQIYQAASINLDRPIDPVHKGIRRKEANAACTKHY